MSVEIIKKQGGQIWTKSGSDWPQMRQFWDFSDPDQISAQKVQYLSLLGPIATHFWPKSDMKHIFHIHDYNQLVTEHSSGGNKIILSHGHIKQ